jgi:hypothetical protein
MIEVTIVAKQLTFPFITNLLVAVKIGRRPLAVGVSAQFTLTEIFSTET